MSDSPFPRLSSFAPSEPERPVTRKERREQVRAQRMESEAALARESSAQPDLERWYRMVQEWSHSTPRRLAHTNVVTIPVEEIEELRDELYAHLR